MAKIYLDVCCLKWPSGDQRQTRIRLELETILLMPPHLETHEWAWVSREGVDCEVRQRPDSERRVRRVIDPVTRLKKI